MLYARNFGTVEKEGFREAFFAGVFESNIDEAYLEEMFETILEKEAFLIYVIQKFAPKFQVENMDLVYVLPIFIGACEMLFLKEQIPAKVSMNEAIEIAKVYGDDSSKKIVNGVLNKIVTEIDELSALSKTFDY
jgi:N utilization substance protein B